MHKLLLIICLLNPLIGYTLWSDILADNHRCRLLNEGWGFSREVVKARGVFPTITIPDTDTIVNLPHSWNSADYLSQNYYRGIGTYVKRIVIPESKQGRRFFLRFEGASQVATVFVNNRYVGEHRGAYTAFCLEITDAIQWGRENNISVFVDNSHRFDVAPQMGDFNIGGGLHRNVWLIETDATCISPLYFGTHGLLVHTEEVSNEFVRFKAEVHLSTLTDYQDCLLSVTLCDALGHEVLSQTCDQLASDTRLEFRLENPHLWNGASDPYLYQIEARLWRNGVQIDSVSDKTGFRAIDIDPDQGFALNGHRLKIHGVNRHEDYPDCANALADSIHTKDFDLMEEMGVNAVRLCHYPQSQFVLDECDRRGMLAWSEMPMVGSAGYVESEQYDIHLSHVLTEMICQLGNHPSIFSWGLFNEVKPNCREVLPKLQALAHRLDSSRPTTVATNTEEEYAYISDLTGWNLYHGWYGRQVNTLRQRLDQLHAQHPLTPLGLSEYGAGAGIHTHVAQYDTTMVSTQLTRSKFHPEEVQFEVLAAHLPIIESCDYLWGGFLWVMFDFASTNRNEGEMPHINDKGLITYDRSEKKDAYWLYKANWNPSASFTHLCSKRFAIRKEVTTDVVVVTTDSKVQLIVNGKNIGNCRADSTHICRWKMSLLQQERTGSR